MTDDRVGNATGTKRTIMTQKKLNEYPVLIATAISVSTDTGSSPHSFSAVFFTRLHGKL
jgi:hypothetical protein